MRADGPASFSAGRPWRESRLRSSAAITRCFRQGRRARRGVVGIAFYEPTGLPFPRFALAVSRRLGGAVDRNRVKRWLREALRDLAPLCRPGVDVVVIPSLAPGEASFDLYRRELRKLLAQAGALARPSDPTR